MKRNQDPAGEEVLRLRNLFNAYDKDHNGWLDKKEFQKLIEACDFGWKATDADRVFDRYDNGDGKFDLAEWTCVCQQMKLMQAQALLSGEVCCFKQLLCGTLLCCPCFLCTAGLSYVGLLCCAYFVGRSTRSIGASLFLTQLPEVGRYHAYVPQPDDLLFAAFTVGDRVEIKDAKQLNAVLISSTSQWGKELGPKCKNDRTSRLVCAGLSGVVKTCDADKTLEIAIEWLIPVDGTKQIKPCWFTPEMVARIVPQLTAGPQGPVATLDVAPGVEPGNSGEKGHNDGAGE